MTTPVRASLNFDLPLAGFKGFYKLEVLNADKEVVRSAEFENLVVGSGLDYICNGMTNTINGSSGAFWRCSVGAGNTPPSISDTLLVSPITSVTTPTNLGLTAVAGSPPYVQRAVQWDFPVGAVVGNVAEVGCGPGTYNVTPLFSRSLVLDGGGSPTVVPVLITESLRVTYYLRCYILTTDVTGSISIGGTPYNYVIRASAWNYTSAGPANGFPLNFNNIVGIFANSTLFMSTLNLTGLGVTGIGMMAVFASSTLGTIAQVPDLTGGATVAGTAMAAVGTYNPGDYFKDVKYTIGLANGNFAGGIGAVVYGGNCGLFQMSFTPNLPKTALLDYDLTFRISIANYP